MTRTNHRVGACEADRDRYGKVNPCLMNIGGKWCEPGTLLCVGVEWEKVKGWTITLAEEPNGWNAVVRDQLDEQVVDNAGEPPYQNWKV